MPAGPGCCNSRGKSEFVAVQDLRFIVVQLYMYNMVYSGVPVTWPGSLPDLQFAVTSYLHCRRLDQMLESYSASSGTVEAAHQGGCWKFRSAESKF